MIIRNLFNLSDQTLSMLELKFVITHETQKIGAALGEFRDELKKMGLEFWLRRDGVPTLGIRKFLKVQGYVKPFLDQVKIDENEPKRELPGNFLLSILTFLYEDEEPESVSTKIPFLMKKGFKVESPGLLKTIIKHGIDQDLKRGLDHQLTL